MLPTREKKHLSSFFLTSIPTGWRRVRTGAILPPVEELFAKGRPEYPWQLTMAPWTPHAKLAEAERRADHARRTFEWEDLDREEGLGGHPLLFYDGARDLFRFSDGTFALSREHANWPALKAKGFFREYGL